MKISTKSIEFSENAVFNYNILLKIYETKSYLYICLNKKQAFAIKKTNINNGTVEELIALLRDKMGSKYVKCI